MRVALQTTTGRTQWLAGQAGVIEREFSSASGFRVNGQIQTQDDEFIRAVEAGVIDRGNLRTTIEFSTVRKFSTAHAAELWMLDYDSTMERTGVLIIESVQVNGGVSRRYMKNAVVLPPKREANGVSVSLSYTVLGGSIKSTP